MVKSILLAASLSCALFAAPPTPKGDPSSHAASENIRGTMTLKEISQKTQVPLDHFIKALKLDKSIDTAAPVRDWIHSKGMTMQNVRDAAASYKAPRK